MVAAQPFNGDTSGSYGSERPGFDRSSANGSRSNGQVADEPVTVTLAKQGDPQAIATLMNRSLKSHAIVAKVARKGNCLAVLLESGAVPNRQSMMAFVQRGIGHLRPAAVMTVKVYGRQSGQTLPTWSDAIDLDPFADSTKTLSLLEWLSQGQIQRDAIESNGEGSDQIAALQTQKFLRFHFSAQETALLPLSSVKEVLQVAVAGILPVPHMPDCVLGLYNCRGEMVWLIDLAQQLGFPSVLMDAPLPMTVTAIALQDQSRSIAVVVPQVSNVEIHPLQHLQPPSVDLCPAQLLPFMQGYLARSSSPVLNVKALIHDPMLRVHG